MPIGSRSGSSARRSSRRRRRRSSIRRSSGSPHGLADALIRLEQTSELVAFSASPATEPLYTINPFAEEGLAALFVTHPPVGTRVRRLRELDPNWRERLRAA